MASAALTKMNSQKLEANSTPKSSQEDDREVILKIGNLRFCQGCRNLMHARASGDKLSWKCSIECLFNQEKTDEEASNDRLVILSQTTDNDFSHSQNPHNVFTKYDPSLLRTMKVCPNVKSPKHKEHPNEKSEMIIFKQNLVTADSYYICTVCGRNISLEDQLLKE